MKVIHLNFTEKYGGAAKAVNRLHKELLRQGIDSKMLVLKKETNDPDVIAVSSLYSNRDKSVLFLRKVLNRISKLLINPRQNYSNKSMLLTVLDKLEYDIIHLHWVTDGFINLSEFNNADWKTVWTMHDCAAFTGICHVIGPCNNFITKCGKCPLIKSNERYDVSNKEFIRKMKLYKKIGIHFVSPSKWLASTASKSPLMKDTPIKVIPHGLDIEKYFPINKISAKRVLGIKDNVKVIFCGAVTLGDENKGFHLLSAALSNLKRDLHFDEKIEILVFGEGSEKEIEFVFKTKFLGYVNDELLMQICYSAADVVVLPSRQEAFGLIAIEAMACGTPVVAFGATGFLDIISNKENGYLAIPYDPADLSLGIKWCLENNENLKLSENARLNVTSSFGIAECTRNYIDLYNKILADK